MTSRLLFLLLFILLFDIQKIGAQGCSDAGFCSIGSMKPDDPLSDPQNEYSAPGDSVISTRKEYHHQLTLQCPMGIGDDHTYISTPALQYTQTIGKRWGIQAKITGNYASGHLGETAGMGDLYLSGEYKMHVNQRWNIIYTGGCKLPFNNGDIGSERPMPMVYQSSLGTFDLLLGATLSHEHFKLSVGYQLPLTRQNENHYTQSTLTGTPLEQYATAYPNTYHLHRKSDLLIRASYIAEPLKNFRITAGLLGIYHTADDDYEDPADHTLIRIEGSSGITLNITAGFSYQLTERLTFSLSGGKPLVYRKVRPDGLTREWVILPEISVAF